MCHFFGPDERFACFFSRSFLPFRPTRSDFFDVVFNEEPPPFFFLRSFFESSVLSLVPPLQKWAVRPRRLPILNLHAEQTWEFPSIFCSELHFPQISWVARTCVRRHQWVIQIVILDSVVIRVRDVFSSFALEHYVRNTCRLQTHTLRAHDIPGMRKPVHNKEIESIDMIFWNAYKHLCLRVVYLWVRQRETVRLLVV